MVLMKYLKICELKNILKMWTKTVENPRVYCKFIWGKRKL